MLCRWTFAFILLTAVLPLLAIGQESSLQTMRRDPEALALLTQAINAAGGLPAVAAIHDYAASGQITMNLDQIVSGDVSLIERGSDLRVDVNLPDGPRHWY